MNKEYVTVVAESSADFSAGLNRHAKNGFVLDKFEYSEYPTRGKDSSVDIYQTYVGVMVKDAEPVAAV